MVNAPDSAPSGAKARLGSTHEQQLRKGIHLSGLPDGEVVLFVLMLNKAEFVSATMRPRFAPTVRELMELCGKSRATVFRRLAHLERHRWAVPPLNPARGPSARIIRVLQLGERCDCPKRGGSRRRKAEGESTQLATPERVSSWKPSESHLGTDESLTLKLVSAGETGDSAYGAPMGEGLMGDNGRGRLNGWPSESRRSWPEGTNGWDANRPT